MSDAVFVLIHSPLVGPLTWKRVAEELERRGRAAIVPTLTSALGAGPPYWRRHAEQVGDALANVPSDTPLVLVGHSAAGFLLPAVRSLTRRPVAAYVFADAGVPEDGRSRFELFGDDEVVEGMRASAVNGMLPSWDTWFPEEAVAEIVPDPQVREALLAEARPVPLVVFEEPIPVFDDWPDAPCAYLQFSPIYDAEVRRARERYGCRHMRLEGGHFHMLVEPSTVTNALLELASAT